MSDKATVNEDISNEVPAAETPEAKYVPADLDFGMTEAIQAEANEEITEDDVAEVEAAADEDGDLEEVVSEDVPEGDDDEPDADSDVDEELEPEAAERSDDTEPEAEAEPEPTLAKKKAPKKPMVPKARLDEVLAKQRELQKRLDEMQAASKQPEPEGEPAPAYDFEAKELEYQELVLDGESKAAAALRQEMRQAERDMIRAEMKSEMSETVGQDRIANAMQQAANQIEENFPVFDSKSEHYDESMTNEVISLRDAFITQGTPPVEALGKAASYVIKANDLYDGSDPADIADTDARVDEVAQKRRTVKKKLQAAEQQPPELPASSSAKSNEGIDISVMTDEEFAALPEATIKRLRGDIV